jgi:hypothetical protein
MNRGRENPSMKPERNFRIKLMAWAITVVLTFGVVVAVVWFPIVAAIIFLGLCTAMFAIKWKAETKWTALKDLLWDLLAGW